MDEIRVVASHGRSENAPANGARPQIMVVDDDEDTRLVLRQLLESLGYSVALCSDALIGLERLRGGSLPDIIVLDLVMPGMTGWEFRIVQKREPLWASIPVLALSGDLSPQAAAIDAAAYLSKPVDHTAFIAAVRKIEVQLEHNRTVARASEVQRLVSLGSLVGGIAHEINNPLTFMSAGAEVLQRVLAGNAPLDASARASAQRAAESVRMGLERVAAVVKSVSLFAFAETTEPEPIDVHEVLEASLQIASNELRHSVRLVRDYESVPRVVANATQLAQVFLNLLLHALAAVREHPRKDHEIRVRSSTRPGQVVITIADSASALPASSGRRVFDPLRTEHATGRLELRLGLAVSHELIEAMGGTIEIESNHPAGSRLLVVLPSSEKTVAPHGAVALAPEPATKRPRVVVIDDEPLICELFKHILAPDHDVRTFTDPFEGLDACVADRVDVIICDVMMPELDGIALFERAVVAQPELAERFIFVTGGVFSEPARSQLRRAKRQVLLKPCGSRDLLAAIRAVLPTGPGRVDAVAKPRS